MLKQFVAALAAGSLSSCVIAPKVVDLSTTPESVEVRTKWTEPKRFVWDRIEIVSVNNKFVGSIYVGGSVRMNSGSNLIAAKMTFNRGFDTGPFEAIASVSVDLPRAGSYAMNGEVNGAEVILWVEDVVTGRKVGESKPVPWRMAPKQATPVPVFVPK
jgi:hypothetical protein